MKFAVTSLAFVLAAAVGSAFAAETAPAKPMTAQQSKMSTCSKDAHAKALKGDEYKAFMSTCLKGGETAAPAATKTAAPAATAKETQQEKMKTCNAEAKTKALKGAARKTFMSTCLKGEHEAAPAAH